MKEKEIFFIEKGKKKGPIKLSEITNHNIDSNTLIWFQGLRNWKKISEIPEFEKLELGRKLPPRVPTTIEAKMKHMEDLSSGFWKLFSKKIKYILGSFLVFGLLAFVFLLQSNSFYKLYRNNIEDHYVEYRHSTDDYCDDLSLPYWYEKSELFYSDDVSPYGYSKETMIEKIVRSDSARFAFASAQTYPYDYSEYVPMSTEEVEEVYRKIRCLQHNQSLGYKESEFYNMIEKSIAFGLIVSLIIGFFFLIRSLGLSFIK